MRTFSARFTCSFALLLLFTSLTVPSIAAQGPQTDSRGRRWSSYVEPPAPDPNWDRLRTQQMTFAESLKLLGLSAEYKVTGGGDAGGLVELLPEGMQISAAYLDGDRFKLELGTALPKLPGALQSAMAKVSLEFSANAPTISEAGFEGPISASTKITSSIKYDQIHDPNWAVGVEVQKLFAKFKGEIADGSVNRTVEISLVNLFNTARGLTTPGDLPRDLVIKVDTAKFYNAIVTAAKESPGSGSRAVRGLFIHMNPVLMVAAARNDPSMLAVQKAAVAVQQELASRFPKGVKIEFDDELLGRMLTDARGGPGLAKLASGTNVRQFVDDLTNAYRESIGERSRRELVLVSLKELVTKAEANKASWHALPDGIARPGSIGRIVGYRIDTVADDIYLIGTRSATESSLTIDEIIEGIKASYVNNVSPFCSLDPDPANFGGVQTVRVGGVPVNSRFARTMLDADYLMKKINAGVVKVNSPGYRSLDTILRERTDRLQNLNSMSRLWFFPTPLRAGDIQISGDGGAVLFAGGMQVLSERMVLSREGIIGTGTSDPIANELAVGFTKALPDIESKFSDIARLHGLFDLVLLGKIWRQMDVRSQWIDRLAAMPTTEMPAKTYDGVNVNVAFDAASDMDIYITGGVRLRTSANGRVMMPADEKSLKVLDQKPANSIATVVSGYDGLLPSANTDRTLNIDAATVTRMIARGEFDTATAEIQKMLSADPFNAEAWCLKAEADLQRSRFVSAIDNAERALELSAGDPETEIRASVGLFSAHFMLGESEAALAAMERAVRVAPDSLSVRLFYADALAVLGRFEDARKEFRLIQRAFPYSSRPYVRFGVFEISEGSVMTGKGLIDRAFQKSRTDGDLADSSSALALAEVGMAILEDPEMHLRNAEQTASKVLADKASDPIARLRALTAKALVALAKDNPAEAETVAEQVLRITPANPTILLSIAQWAHFSNKPDLALRYLARAEKIAPNMPLVKAVGVKIRGGR